MTVPAGVPLLALPPIADAEVAGVRRWLRSLEADAARAPIGSDPVVAVRPRPFLVATPLGLLDRASLVRALGVAAARVTPIAGWSRASIALYARAGDDERLRVALAFATVWRRRCPDDLAERWELEPHEYRRLVAEKPSLRRALPVERLRLAIPGVAVRGGGARLHPFHMPDPDAVAADAEVLDRLLSTGRRDRDLAGHHRSA